MSEKTVIVLSDEATAFMNTPARTELMMPMIDQIYSVNCPKRWFPVYTAPRVETKVCRSFTEVGVASYAPMTKDWRQQSRRDIHQKRPKIEIIRPLFARYAFARLPVKETEVDGRVVREDIPFGAVRLIDGVQDFVCARNGPVAVSDAVINKILDREARGEFDARIKKGSGRYGKGGAAIEVMVDRWVDIGAEARIIGGPLDNLLCMIEEILPNERVKVGVSLFGRSSSVEIGLDSLLEHTTDL